MKKISKIILLGGMFSAMILALNTTDPQIDRIVLNDTEVVSSDRASFVEAIKKTIDKLYNYGSQVVGSDESATEENVSISEDVGAVQDEPIEPIQEAIEENVADEEPIDIDEVVEELIEDNIIGDSTAIDGVVGDNTSEGVSSVDNIDVDEEVTTDVIDGDTTTETVNIEITPDNRLISLDKNTSDQVYIDGEITVNNAGDFQLSEETKKSVMDTIRGIGKTVSFYITDPETNTTISYSAQKSIVPASSIKAGMALLTCKMVDTGELSFDDEIMYLSKYTSGGSGTIQYDQVGTKYTIRELVHRCINVSDNIAYKMLIDVVGKDNYNDMVTQLGCSHALSAWQNFGYMCAEDLNLVWQEIYASDREQGEELYARRQAGENVDEKEYSACAVLNFELLDAKYNFLEGALPYESSHKSGFSGGTMNDSGVVYTDQGKLIVSIMTDGQNGNNTAKFNKVAGAIDGIIKEYCSYKENVIDRDNEIVSE